MAQRKIIQNTRNNTGQALNSGGHAFALQIQNLFLTIPVSLIKNRDKTGSISRIIFIFVLIAIFCGWIITRFITTPFWLKILFFSVFLAIVAYFFPLNKFWTNGKDDIQNSELFF